MELRGFDTLMLHFVTGSLLGVFLAFYLELVWLALVLLILVPLFVCQGPLLQTWLWFLFVVDAIVQTFKNWHET